MKTTKNTTRKPAARMSGSLQRCVRPQRFRVSINEIKKSYKSFFMPKDITRLTKAPNSSTSKPGRPSSFKIWCNCRIRVCPKAVKSIWIGDGVTILLSIQPALARRSIKRAKSSDVGSGGIITVVLGPNADLRQDAASAASNVK